MIPPRNFPKGVLKLEEIENNQVVLVHAEMSNTVNNRDRIQRMRNDLLMVNPKLDLRIKENNA